MQRPPADRERRWSIEHPPGERDEKSLETGLSEPNVADVEARVLDDLNERRDDASAPIAENPQNDIARLGTHDARHRRHAWNDWLGVRIELQLDERSTGRALLQS